MGLFGFMRGARQGAQNAKLGAETQKILRSYYSFIVEDLSVLSFANARGEWVSDPHNLAVEYLINFAQRDLNIINDKNKKTFERWIEKAENAKSRGAEISDAQVAELKLLLIMKFGD